MALGVVADSVFAENATAKYIIDKLVESLGGLLSSLLQGSATWDAASIADGDEEAKEITVTGAALGDFVIVSASIDVADLVLAGQVTEADKVTASLANNTGGAIDLASMTVRALVIPRAALDAAVIAAGGVE